jgi:hypothetical protein
MNLSDVQMSKMITRILIFGDACLNWKSID